MLTPDDGSTDGQFLRYLSQPDRWQHHDPDLFHALQTLLSENQERKVSHIENTGLLENTRFFSQVVPDEKSERDNWTKALLTQSEGSDLVFLDPDNGFEIKSVTYGRKRSSKFLYWREAEALWQAGHSLLIYQHFIRENRQKFIQRMLKTLKKHCPGATVEAFSTSHVVFLMALQSRHKEHHSDIQNTVQNNWAGQIWHWDVEENEQEDFSPSALSTSDVEPYRWDTPDNLHSIGWHLLKKDDLSVIEEQVPAGAGEVRHFHSQSRQFFYVLEGEATMEFTDKSITFNAGQGLHVPPGVEHRFCNNSDSPVRFLVISSPSTQGDRTEI